MKTIITIIFSCFIGSIAYANDTIHIPATDTTGNGMKAVEATEPVKAVEKPKTLKPRLVTSKGYRLQVISTRDRKKAIKLKGELMSKHPATKVYLTYKRPNFRVRMGNFKTPDEAKSYRKKYLKDLNRVYLVRDKIVYVWYPGD